MDVIEFIINMKKDDVLPPYKARLKSLQIQRREIEERNR